MTYKQIEASREVRLWITQLIVPVVTTTIAAGIAIPEVRQAVANKCKQVGKSITRKMKKKEKQMETKKVLNNVTWINRDPETGEYRMKKFKA